MNGDGRRRTADTLAALGTPVAGCAAAGGDGGSTSRLPANVAVGEADFPFVWGAETDEVDVPYVVRYRVTSSMIASGAAEVGATLPIAVVVTERNPPPLRATPEVS